MYNLWKRRIFPAQSKTPEVWDFEICFEFWKLNRDKETRIYSIGEM
jgi:hypothetical protein